MPEKKPPMKNRMIRVDDARWEAAQEAAAERDENLSHEIRKFLTDYINRKN